MMKNILIGIVSLLLITSCQQALQKDTPVVKQDFSEIWKFHSGEGNDTLWNRRAYDDKDWAEVVSTKLLSEQKQTLDNGYGWYRKQIVFSDSLKTAIRASGALMLHLGHLAAIDEVWVNGHLVGKTGTYPPNYIGYHDEERNYLAMVDDVNLNGENLIAIKFNQGWGAGGFLQNAQLYITSASVADKLIPAVTPNDSDYIFLGKQPVRITVNYKNVNQKAVKGILYSILMTDAYVPVKKDSVRVTIKGKEAFTKTFEFHNPNPGFYRYKVVFKRNGQTGSSAQLNVGYEPEKIESPIDAKADFKAFWDKAKQDLAKVAPRYKLTLIPEYSKLDYDIYKVDMFSLNKEPVKGYYARPKREGKFPVIVEYMGYGSGPYLPGQTWNGFAYFILSVRGQALNLPGNHYGTWITYGLDDENNYYYRGAFMDVVRALDFVCSRPEVDNSRIAVRGGSQGGALSFAAAALDKRVKVAAPYIPFLSDYRDYFKICPWPKSDFDTYLNKHPETSWNEIYDVLTYFDIKNLAQWIECPLYMGFGVQDNVCPGHINFAAYNQVKSEKRWMACPECSHSVEKAYHEASMKFIKEKLNVE